MRFHRADEFTAAAARTKKEGKNDVYIKMEEMPTAREEKKIEKSLHPLLKSPSYLNEEEKVSIRDN